MSFSFDGTCIDPSTLTDGAGQRQIETPDDVMLVDTVNPGDTKDDEPDFEELESLANLAEGHRHFVTEAGVEGTVRERGNRGGTHAKRLRSIVRRNRKNKVKDLTPEKEMLLEVTGLLVDACSSLLEARKRPEEGEIVDVTGGVPEYIRDAIYTYRPTGPLDAILYEDSKSKVEQAWDEMQAYAEALIRWVQDTRSSTLIPLQKFRQIQSIAQASTARPREFESDSEAAAYVEDRLEEIEDRFDAILARSERIDRQWRSHKASKDVECQARKYIKEASNQVKVIGETSLARLARLQTSRDTQASELDFIQRQIRAMEAEISPIGELRDLCHYLKSAATTASLPGGQSLIIELAHMVGNEMEKVCANRVDAVVHDVVDKVEETKKALVELESSFTNPQDTSTAKLTPESLALPKVDQA